MTEQMQRDLELLGWHFRLVQWDAETLAAWQRIRASLSPDRESVARAIYEALRFHVDLVDSEPLIAADAVIKAMQGETP